MLAEFEPHDSPGPGPVPPSTLRYTALMLLATATPLENYVPIVILLIMVILFAFANVVLTRLIGPSRSGKIKDATYESGMNPIGSARKRFNVRFYIIAMIFLVFDVEVVFLYPWATSFANLEVGHQLAGMYLGRVLFFMATTVIAYIYGWRKGVFRFD